MLPTASIELASLNNVERFLRAQQLTSIFYYEDGFPNAFELAGGDFLTAQDIDTLINDKTQPFTFKHKIFIANACNAFLAPLGQAIVVKGQADAYMAGITAISPQGIAVQLFIHYVLEHTQSFKQAYVAAQQSLHITDFGGNKVQSGIYGMAGTNVPNLFPAIDTSNNSMATIGPLSSTEPFHLTYRFQPSQPILGYALVTIDMGIAVDLLPGTILKVPLKMPVISTVADNFATQSPASFTTVRVPYQGHELYMIGDLSEVFALNQFTGSPASEVIYKDNAHAPTSMPKRIAYAAPWWDDYYRQKIVRYRNRLGRA